MEVTLLKKFYTLREMSENSEIPKQTLITRCESMEIKPDFIMDGKNHYSEESKNKILGYYEFEKRYWETLLIMRKNTSEKVYPSKMNS